MALGIIIYVLFLESIAKLTIDENWQIYTTFLLRYSSITQQSTDENLTKYYKKIIQTLAHDSLKSRPASSIYEDKTAEFIYQELKSIFPTKPQIHHFSYQTDSSHSSKHNKIFMTDAKALVETGITSLSFTTQRAYMTTTSKFQMMKFI